MCWKVSCLPMLSGTADAHSPLLSPQTLPLCPPETVQEWGETLVVAPHPDDESLGCGGAIALLSRHGLSPTVLFISDGTGSHPNSRRCPAPVLRALREGEAREALSRLGASPLESVFLGIKDGAVPSAQSPGFVETVALCRAVLDSVQPQTVLLPWRRDPHPDHRATSEIMRAALSAGAPVVRVLEYPIWTWERAAPEDLPCAGEAQAFRLDITPVFDAKQQAIDAHQSQVTHLIDDDPQGFWLSPEVLAHFVRPWEVYLEAAHL